MVVDQDVRASATDVANADAIQNVEQRQICATLEAGIIAAHTTNIATTGEILKQDHMVPAGEGAIAHNTIVDHLLVLVVLFQSLTKTEMASWMKKKERKQENILFLAIEGKKNRGALCSIYHVEVFCP